MGVRRSILAKRDISRSSSGITIGLWLIRGEGRKSQPVSRRHGIDAGDSRPSSGGLVYEKKSEWRLRRYCALVSSAGAYPLPHPARLQHPLYRLILAEGSQRKLAKMNTNVGVPP